MRRAIAGRLTDLGLHRPVVQHVARDVDEHRALASRHRGAQGLVEERGERRRAAGEHHAVGLRDRDAGRVEELGDREARHARDPAERVAEGPGVRLGGRGHVPEALPRRVVLDRVDDGVQGDERDRGLAVHLVRDVALDGEEHRADGVVVEEERVAVGSGPEHVEGPGDPRRPRHVDDVDRLPPLLRRVGGGQSRRHVGAPAGREADDDLHRLGEGLAVDQLDLDLPAGLRRHLLGEPVERHRHRAGRAEERHLPAHLLGLRPGRGEPQGAREHGHARPDPSCHDVSSFLSFPGPRAVLRITGREGMSSTRPTTR